MEASSFKFTKLQRQDIKKLLVKAIDKDIKSKRELYESNMLDMKRKCSIAQIDIFIKFTELDVDCFKLAGRNRPPLNWFSSQLAERFHSHLEINVTPTKGNEFSEILSICYESTNMIKPDADVYRYANAGIKAINVNKRNVYKLLTKDELSIARAVDSHEQRKRRILTEKRKIKVGVN